MCTQATRAERESPTQYSGLSDPDEPVVRGGGARTRPFPDSRWCRRWLGHDGAVTSVAVPPWRRSRPRTKRDRRCRGSIQCPGHGDQTLEYRVMYAWSGDHRAIADEVQFLNVVRRLASEYNHLPSVQVNFQ